MPGEANCVFVAVYDDERAATLYVHPTMRPEALEFVIMQQAERYEVDLRNATAFCIPGVMVSDGPENERGFNPLERSQWTQRTAF